MPKLFIWKIQLETILSQSMECLNELRLIPVEIKLILLPHLKTHNEQLTYSFY